MFNEQIMEANDIDFPDNPTWDQIAEIARQVNTDETAGICLRGNGGWDQIGFPITTVVNTFGGTWWRANADGTPGEALIAQPDSGFRQATQFYVDLLQDAGPQDAANFDFDRCLEEFQNGNIAIWYGSTAAAPILEADDSPIAGNVGYTLAPTNITDQSGWLQTWGFGIPANGPPDGRPAWEFISWATSPQTAQLAGGTFGWGNAPQPARLSIYDTPEYVDANQPYIDVVRDCLLYTSPSPRDKRQSRMPSSA